MTAPRRWDGTAWLTWAGACALLYTVSLAAFVVATAAAGRGLSGVAMFTAWYGGGLTVATVLVAAWQLGRRP